MGSERRQSWHESMSPLWEALGYVILFVGLVFGVTRCSRCELERRMNDLEYERAQQTEVDRGK